MKAPFTSTQIFRNAFNQQLHTLAELDGLGPFILACANASTHSELFEDMKASLEKQYQNLYNTYRSAFMDGRDIPVVDEDLLVFLKLHAIGFESIKPSEFRQEGIWKLQFNHLRSFRPRRITQYIHTGMFQRYDEDDFNFNKPFMAKECFWRGELLGCQIDLFYNKYPFADLHGLLVMNREECKSQLLDQHDHRYVFRLAEVLEENLKGVGFGYNSYGAYASVNHLHFQMFIDPDGLPVADPCWHHNGGQIEYPAACHVFESAESSWQFIQLLHDKLQPYNLLYVPGKVYVFPRKIQGTVEVPDWSSGFTWYELSGGMILFNYHDYKHLHESDIERYLKLLRPE